MAHYLVSHQQTIVDNAKRVSNEYGCKLFAKINLQQNAGTPDDSVRSFDPEIGSINAALHFINSFPNEDKRSDKSRFEEAIMSDVLRYIEHPAFGNTTVNVALVIIDGKAKILVMQPNVDFLNGTILIHYKISFTDAGTIEYAIASAIAIHDIQTFGFVLYSFVAILTKNNNFAFANTLLETYLEYFCENPGNTNSGMCVEFVQDRISKPFPPFYSLVFVLMATICNFDAHLVEVIINAVLQDMRSTFQKTAQQIPECRELDSLSKNALISSPDYIPSIEPLFEELPQEIIEESFEKYIQETFVGPIKEQLDNAKRTIDEFGRFVLYYLALNSS